MLSQRCFSRQPAVALVLLCVLLSGCAEFAAVTAPASGRPATKTAGTEASSGTIQYVPPQALTLFERATAALAAGDFVEAEFGFKELSLLYPDYPGAYVNLAIIHAHNDDDEAAKAAIDAALALNASHPVALNQAGMLFRRNGKFLEAEAAYLKAVTVSPDYALAHYNLGVLYELYMQRLDKALQHFVAYQSIVGEDRQVDKWIADLRRRVAAIQRTANATD